MVSITLRLLYPGEIPGTLFPGGWVGLGTRRNGTENLSPTGIRSPDLPARSDLLYRLTYSGLAAFNPLAPEFPFKF